MSPGLLKYYCHALVFFILEQSVGHLKVALYGPKQQ